MHYTLSGMVEPPADTGNKTGGRDMPVDYGRPLWHNQGMVSFL